MQLKVGVGRRVITPPMGHMLQGYTPARPALSVHDDVHITAFAFETEGVRSLLFSAELCNIWVEIMKRFKRELEAALGIPGGNMIISCTHTHSSGHISWGYEEDPDHNYAMDVVLTQAIEAAKEALGNLKPARMGVGTTWSDVAVNRRQIKEETGKVMLGQNPYGSWDPTMTVVAFREPDGTPIGNIIHYGCHNTASGRTDEVTRDWAGVMVDRLESQTGAVTAFVNGCGGDCGPRLPNGKTTGNLKMAQELGGKAGIDAVKAYNNISIWEDAPMRVLSTQISLPLMDVGTAEDAEAEAAKLAAAHELKGTVLSSYNHLLERAEYLREGNVPPTEKAIDQTFIALGDLVLQAIPFEVFSIITLRIREGSPYRHTLCLGYSNGSLSYFPSMDQIIRGGYEVRRFKTVNLIPFRDDSEQHFVTQSLEYIRGMHDE